MQDLAPTPVTPTPESVGLQGLTPRSGLLWLCNARRRMNRMLGVLALLCIPSLCFGFGWQPQAYHLVDDKTGLPLVTLDNGLPEAFLMGGGKLLFYGFFTQTEIEQDEPLAGRNFQDVDSGSRFKLRGKDQWVRVESWCCDDYNWVKTQYLSGWVEYHRELGKKLENFGVDPDNLPFRLNGECSPFVYSPVYLFDPVTLKPRWTKFYAVARKGYDRSFMSCDRDKWNVYSYAYIGSSLDAESVLIKLDDAKATVRFLRVSALTGEIMGRNSGGIKVIDAADVLRFKDEFLRRNPCPIHTEAEKKQLLGTKLGRFTKTSAGRCFIERHERYEESAIRHFLGEPTEELMQ